MLSQLQPTMQVDDQGHKYWTILYKDYLRLHRTDGPAYIDAKDGFLGWYVNDKNYLDVYEWAYDALEWMGIKVPTPQQIENHMQQAYANAIML